MKLLSTIFKFIAVLFGIYLILYVMTTFLLGGGAGSITPLVIVIFAFLCFVPNSKVQKPKYRYISYVGLLAVGICAYVYCVYSNISASVHPLKLSILRYYSIVFLLFCSPLVSVLLSTEVPRKIESYWITGFKRVLYFIGCLGCLIVFLVVLFAFLSSSGVKERARMSFVQSNLKSVGMGLVMYLNENDEKFPDKLSELYPVYVKEIRLFFYKDDKKKIITPENIDSLGCFEIVSGITPYDDPGTIIAREKSNNHWKEPVSC